MKFLPKDINWINPYECSSNSWRMVLVAVNKHSVRDWEILFGCINPVDNYSDYKIEVGDKEIDKSDIIAVGLLQTYGNIGQNWSFMNCSYCSSRLLETDRNCPNCGAPFSMRNIEKIDAEENRNYYLDGLIAIALQGGDTSIYRGSKKELKVFGLSNSASPFLLLNTWLIFESENNGVLLISNDGWIYGNRKGRTKLRIYCKDNPKLETSFVVEVV